MWKIKEGFFLPGWFQRLTFNMKHPCISESGNDLNLSQQFYINTLTYWLLIKKNTDGHTFFLPQMHISSNYILDTFHRKVLVLKSQHFMFIFCLWLEIQRKSHFLCVSLYHAQEYFFLMNYQLYLCQFVDLIKKTLNLCLT